MPLNAAAGEAEWDKYNNYDNPGVTPFDTEQKAIDGWAEILEKVATAVVPASTGQAAAKAAFKATAVGMAAPGAAGAILAAACNAYGAALGAGMTGYTPSALPVFTPADFSDPSLNAGGVTSSVAAALIVGKIVAKFQAGISNLSVFPFTPTPWT